MKKLLSIFGILLFVGSMFITSCSSKSSVCPAYPPSTYNGEIQKQINQDINIKNIELETIENL